MFIRLSCRTTWVPINVRLQHYCRTTWDYIVVQHEIIIKHYYYSLMRKVVKENRFYAEIHFLRATSTKTSWQNIEGNIYNEERHSFLSYSHPGLTAGANSSFY